jgi:hypothetical protein
MAVHAPPLFNHAQPLDVTVPSINSFTVQCFKDLALIGDKGIVFAYGRK